MAGEAMFTAVFNEGWCVLGGSEPTVLKCVVGKDLWGRSRQHTFASLWGASLLHGMCGSILHGNIYERHLWIAIAHAADYLFIRDL